MVRKCERVRSPCEQMFLTSTFSFFLLFLFWPFNKWKLLRLNETSAALYNGHVPRGRAERLGEVFIRRG